MAGWLRGRGVTATFAFAVWAARHMEVDETPVELSGRHREEWLETVRMRAARRDDAPRCLEILGGASATVRQGWYRQASRVIGWRVARHVFGLLVVAALAGVIVTTEFALGEAATWIVFVVVVLGTVLAGLASALAGLGDPLLVVGRVERGVTTHIPEAPRPLKRLILRWIEKGSLGRATVDVRTAAQLTPQGELRGWPDWCGEREVGMRWGAARRLIEGERCVLVCASNGLILDCLTDFTRRESAITRRARGVGVRTLLARGRPRFSRRRSLRSARCRRLRTRRSPPR
jgi:hypothetical protein